MPIPRLAVALALLALPAWGGSAQACSIAAPTPGAPLPADVVFVGTVTAVPPEPDPAEEPVFTDDPVAYTFAVERVLHGTLPEAAPVVWTARYDAACGVAFRPGGRYLVAALRSEGPWGDVPPDGLITGLGQGSRPLEPDAPVTGEDLVWPAPLGFDAARSDLTPRRLRTFRPFPVQWSSEWTRLRRITVAGTSVTVAYAGFSVRTTQLCRPRPGARAAALTPRAPLLGVRAGRRGGDLVLLTGRQEVRIHGLPEGRARRIARGLVTANGPSPGTNPRNWVPAVPDAALRVPCADPPGPGRGAS